MHGRRQLCLFEQSEQSRAEAVVNQRRHAAKRHSAQFGQGFFEQSHVARQERAQDQARCELTAGAQMPNERPQLGLRALSAAIVTVAFSQASRALRRARSSSSLERSTTKPASVCDSRATRFCRAAAGRLSRASNALRITTTSSN